MAQFIMTEVTSTNHKQNTRVAVWPEIFASMDDVYAAINNQIADLLDEENVDIVAHLGGPLNISAGNVVVVPLGDFCEIEADWYFLVAQVIE